MGTPNNWDRQNRAQYILDVYMTENGHDDPGEAMIDLIADMKHLAGRLFSEDSTINNESIFRMADTHYQEEIDSE